MKQLKKKIHVSSQLQRCLCHIWICDINIVTNISTTISSASLSLSLSLLILLLLLLNRIGALASQLAPRAQHSCPSPMLAALSSAAAHSHTEEKAAAVEAWWLGDSVGYKDDRASLRLLFLICFATDLRRDLRQLSYNVGYNVKPLRVPTWQKDTDKHKCVFEAPRRS